VIADRIWGAADPACVSADDSVRFEGFHLKAKDQNVALTVSNMCHIRSTAEPQRVPYSLDSGAHNTMASCRCRWPGSFRGGCSRPSSPPLRLGQTRFQLRQFLKLPVFLKLTNMHPFASWLVLIGDATPDGIRVVRSVLGAVGSLPIVAFRE